MPATFGMTIRAARLGYRKVDGVGFVRVLAGGPPHQIDICPLDDVPSGQSKNKHREHVVWWDPDCREFFGTWFRKLTTKEPSRPISIWVDDFGEKLREAPLD